MCHLTCVLTIMYNINCRNVRGWCLFRSYLGEIPEVGIFIAGCYDWSDKNENTAIVSYKNAGIASDIIIHRSGELNEGTADFKRRFMEVSRVGTLMVTESQVDQLHHSSGANIDHQDCYQINLNINTNINGNLNGDLNSDLKLSSDVKSDFKLNFKLKKERKSYQLKESELTSEVLKSIERREIAIWNLRSRSHNLFQYHAENLDIKIPCKISSRENTIYEDINTKINCENAGEFLLKQLEESILDVRYYS